MRFAFWWSALKYEYVLKIFFVFFAVLIFLPVLSCAQEMLSIEKVVEQPVVSAGGTVRILLNITNPFGTDLEVKVRDNNSVGGTTVDTVCQPAVLSVGSGVAFYVDLQVFAPGNYTLGTIKMKYTNPLTGAEEVAASSETVTVSVLDSPNANAFASSFQTIMNCQFDDEQQQSSKEQQEQSSEEEQSVMDKLKEMMQKEQKSQQPSEMSGQQQSPMQQKLSSARQNQGQDMQSVRDSLQKQAEQDHEQLEDTLSDALLENKDFQEMQQDLEDKGYEPESSDIPPLKGNETNFTYNYKNDKGESGIISGNMKDGEISDLKKMSAEDKKELQDALAGDVEFNEARRDLEKQGYEMKETSFDGLDKNNKTEFRSNFKSADGKSANVTGSVEDGVVSDVGHISDDDISDIREALENSEEYDKVKEMLESKNMSLPAALEVEPIKNNMTTVRQGNVTAKVLVSGNETKVLSVDFDDGRTLFDKLKFPFAVLVLLVLVVSYYLYLKRNTGDACGDVISSFHRKRKVNPRRAALAMLTRSEKLFEEGKMKEAYTGVSKAVRFYFRHVLGLEDKGEFTSADAVRLLRDSEYKDISVAKECFSICDLVKFAKYKPNRNDFEKVLALGRKIVGK
ncbi:MAG: hypothetical protein U9P44_01365 [archaeon]|nr:hypothetical protein [archaeon]